MRSPAEFFSPPRAGTRQWLGLAVLVLPCLLLVIDITVLFLALPAIAGDLGADGTQQLWIMDIYGFLIAGFLVTMGTLGDRVGRRRLLMIGAAAFAVASVIAAFSTSAAMLIAARALLGVAGATVMPSTLSLIRNMFLDTRQRATAIAIWSSSMMGGLALGPVVGGILLEFFWWGSVFLLGVPVMAVVLIAGPFLLPEYRDPQPGRLDLISVALSLAAILPVVYAIKDAAGGSGGLVTVSALLVGFMFGTMFIRRQLSLTYPLMDLSLFRHRAFSVGLATVLMSMMLLGAFGLLFAQYLQLMLGLSPATAGLWMIPMASGSIAGALLTPMLTARMGDNRLMAIGLVLGAAGLAVFALSQGQSGMAVAMAGSIAIGLGFSPLIVVVNTIVLGTAPKEKSGSAASISETCQEVGAALGIAVFGALLTLVYRLSVEIPEATPDGAADAAGGSMPGAAAAAETLPAPQAAELLAATQAAFGTGLSAVSTVGAGVALILAVLAGLFLKPGRERGPQTEQQATGLHSTEHAAAVSP